MSMAGNYEKTQQNPCYWCVRAIKWIPVIFILAIIGWSYYAYVVQLCLIYVKTMVERIFFLLFYHIIFTMFFWSYWQTVFTTVGAVPQKFRVPRTEMEKLANADSQDTQRRLLEAFAKDLPLNNRTITGTVRFCDKCMLVKPDRAHHCSVCGMCVLKMDHHCPWVNNCVNFTNYKFFVLFLGYALVYCIYVASTALKYFILFWENQLPGGMGRFHILFLFFVAVMFAISLISLFGYHIYLVTLNRTTLEAFRAPIFRINGPDKNGYNLGHYNNLQEVFGDDRKLWLLPVFSSCGDGLVYPVHEKHINLATMVTTRYESMGDTHLCNNTINDNNDDDNNSIGNNDNADDHNNMTIINMRKNSLTNNSLNSDSNNATTTTTTTTDIDVIAVNNTSSSCLVIDEDDDDNADHSYRHHNVKNELSSIKRLKNGDVFINV